MASNLNGKAFFEKNKEFVLKLRLVGAGTPQIRRVRLPRVAVNDAVSYDCLVEIAIQYTFPSAPLNPEDYKTVFTYYDVDNDCVTIASTAELIDAIDQFSAVNEKVLRITTDVKRKRHTNSFTTPPRTPSRGSSPIRRSSPPATSPQRKAHAQLQSALEAFASVLAAAVVAIQAQINPAGPVASSRVLACSSVAPAAVAPNGDNDGEEEDDTPMPGSTPERAIDLTGEEKEDKPTEEAPKDENEVDERPFIHGRHTCDGCLCTPIVGTRFHAKNLPDYDLCAKCRDNYKGDYIQFEEAKLDRDMPFQNRWNHKRAIYGRGRFAGPRPRHGRAPNGPRGRHMPGPRGRHAVNPGKRDEMALKEALRRSLQDMAVLQKEKVVGTEEEAKPVEVPEPTSPMEDSKPLAAAEEPKAEDVPPTETATTKEDSFSSDAAGNGDVAQVLGATLDQCAEAIDAMMDELDRESKADDASEKAEREIVVGSDSEEAEREIVVESDDSVPSCGSAITADVVGATIVEATAVSTVEEDEDKKSVQSEDDWSVVGEEARDEMIAGALEAIGSALYQSDLNTSEEVHVVGNLEASVLSASSSVPTSVPSISSDAPIADIVLERWAPQLTQLRELGFYEDRQSVEILERLEAANIGVGSMDEITVTQVVNEMLKQK